MACGRGQCVCGQMGNPLRVLSSQGSSSGPVGGQLTVVCRGRVHTKREKSKSAGNAEINVAGAHTTPLNAYECPFSTKLFMHAC